VLVMTLMILDSLMCPVMTHNFMQIQPDNPNINISKNMKVYAMALKTSETLMKPYLIISQKRRQLNYLVKI
jgi:hypothetical protein